MPRNHPRADRLFWLLTFLLAACAPAASATPTATLPAPSPIPPTSTPAPTLTPSPTVLLTPTDQAGCLDSALYLADLTIPDDSVLAPGAGFTKTWRLKNTGSCTWNERYSLVFIGGERLNSPAEIPLVETAPGASLDISLPLTAPTTNGTFTSLYALHTPRGLPIPIGALTSMWVKIRVEQGTPAPLAPSTAPTAPLPAGEGIASCQYSLDGAQVSELAGLINSARAEAGMPALTLNAALSAAAQGHSLDMACNNFLDHRGSDGSWIGDRLAAAGYGTFHYVEIIAIGSPQNAMSQWRNSASHWEAVLDASMTEFGVGYIYAPGSSFGGYFTVDLASP